MDQLPTEILQQFALIMDYEDLMEYCRVSKKTTKICNDNIFWLQKITHDFNIYISDQNAFFLYKMIIKMIDLYPEVYSLFKLGNNNAALLKLLENKNPDLHIVKILIKHGATNLNEAMLKVVQHSDPSAMKELFSLLLRGGATNPDHAIQLAIALGNNQAIYNLSSLAYSNDVNIDQLRNMAATLWKSIKFW